MKTRRLLSHWHSCTTALPCDARRFDSKPRAARFKRSFLQLTTHLTVVSNQSLFFLSLTCLLLRCVIQLSAAKLNKLIVNKLCDGVRLRGWCYTDQFRRSSHARFVALSRARDWTCCMRASERARYRCSGNTRSNVFQSPSLDRVTNWFMKAI